MAAAAAAQAAAAALGSRPAPQPFSGLVGENYGSWMLKVSLLVTALPQARDRMLYIVQCLQGEALSRFFSADSGPRDTLGRRLRGLRGGGARLFRRPRSARPAQRPPQRPAHGPRR